MGIKKATFTKVTKMAEEEGFEPSLELTPYYRFSKPAPSANLGTPPTDLVYENYDEL